jgi:hypothetical protein
MTEAAKECDEHRLPYGPSPGFTHDYERQVMVWSTRV